MHDNTSPTRALVLGGGGSTGNAWLIGVVAGLAHAGLDVTDADLIIGTSAGATAAAQLTGAPPAHLLDGILAARPSASPARGMHPQAGRPGGTPNGGLNRIQGVIAASSGPADLRRRLGASALEALASSPDAGWQDRWRATVASRLPSQEWPRRNVWITPPMGAGGREVVPATVHRPRQIVVLFYSLVT